MSGTPKQNLSDLGFIGLNCKKLKVAVFGGGRAAELKTAFFAKRAALVTVFSPEISVNMQEMQINWQQCRYQAGQTAGFHLVVIATSDPEVNLMIKEECEEQCKLYLYAPEAGKSLFSCPAQGESDTAFFAVQCKETNPKLAVRLKARIAALLDQENEKIINKAIEI